MRHLFAILIAFLLGSTASAAGLLAPTDETLPPLRVTDHLVNVQIRDGVAVTRLKQTFRNDTERRLEATYVFPLPENADLTDFQMSFNGKMVQGKVLPAAEAARIYEQIVRRIKDPGLIEFIGRRLLQMKVFPIEPKSDTTIQVRYQQICRPIGGMTGYHYPLRTRKTTGQAYGTVRFAIELETSAPLKNIWSPTHAVEIVRDGSEHAAKIAYEASGGSLDEDFLLLYNTDASDLGLSVVACKPDEDAAGHFVLMLTPKQLWPEEAYQPQDVVFIIDTSGSMAGEKIDQARAALRFCIDRLDERDRFSVVRFSTGFDVLFESVQNASKGHRARAKEWIGQFKAAGGTNIADTLEHVMEMRPAAGADDPAGARPFVAVFLTDGRGNRGPGEIMDALAKAGGEKSSLRIFPFGVGHDVNTILLDRLADTYTGRTTYVQPGENLELVLGDFFGVISRPVLTNLHIALPDIGVTERFPAALGDLYHGQQLIIAGRFSEDRPGPVKLTADRGGARIEYVWPAVAFTHTAGADYIASVWAGRKIAYLIDQIRAHGESEEMIGEILALSQEYGIQTPYSSWLIVPERYVHAPGGSPGRRPPGIRGRAGGGLGGGAGGGAGGGGARGVASRETQQRRLGGVVPEGSVFHDSEAQQALSEADLSYGDEFGRIDLLLAGQAVTEEAGEAANLIARKNASLRDLRSRDAGRLDRKQLIYQKLGDRWYNRIGAFLVDEAFGEETGIIVIRFASEAYFELVRNRPDLRPALAASPRIVVMVTDRWAVLVSDRVGGERFSDEQRKQIDLDER